MPNSPSPPDRGQPQSGKHAFGLGAAILVWAIVVWAIYAVFHRLLTDKSALPVEFVDQITWAALVVIVAVCILESIVLAPTWRQSVPPFLIFLITILSFFAFGLEVSKGNGGAETIRLHLSFSELAAILVLFFLSELTVRLTARIEKVSQQMESVGANMNSVSTTIANSELVTKVHQTSGLTKVFEGLFAIKDETLWRHVWEKLGVEYTMIWAERTKLVSEARPDPAETTALSLCWRTVVETYVDEEKADIQGDAQRGITLAPQLATNQTMYLNLLTALATAVSAETSPFRQNGRVPVLQGISHILPEFWYNWEKSTKPPRYHRYGPIDLYRNTVAQLVAKARATGCCLEYRRLLLVDGHQQQLEAEGIKPLKTLKDQAKLVLITPDKCFAADKMIPPDRDHIKMFQKLFPNWKVFHEFDSSEDYYLIVTEQELKDLQAYGPRPDIPPLKDLKQSFLTVLRFGEVEQKLYLDRLALKFLRDLHIQDGHAEVSVTNIEARRALKELRSDHDLLMVGYRERGAADVKWQMALTTNLRPGIETMLLHVIYETTRLKELADWCRGITTDVKPLSLAQALELTQEELA